MIIKVLPIAILLLASAGCTKNMQNIPGIGVFDGTVKRLEEAASTTVGAVNSQFSTSSDESDKNESKRKSFLNVFSKGLAATAGIVCAKTVGKKGGVYMLGCGLSALAAHQITNLLGDKIIQGLKEDEQREVLVAASQALKTGEPVTVKLPKSQTTISILPSNNIKTKNLKLPIQIDTALVFSNIPTLHVIGDAYKARRKVSVYKSSSKKERTRKMLKNEEMQVLGKANNSNRMLIAKWIMSEEDDYPVPMAIGFVEESQLKKIKSELDLDESSMTETPRTLETIEINAIVKCREVELKRKDDDGKIIEDKVLNCSGPDGLPLNV